MLLTSTALSRITITATIIFSLTLGYLLGKTHSPTDLEPPLLTRKHIYAKVPPLIKARIEKVPRIIHYIFGLSPDFGGKPFGFIQFLSIMSVRKNMPSARIYFHLIYEPTGWYWDQVRPHIRLIKARKVTSIFDNPVEHFAHKSDVLRLEVLRDLGGIYLDLDVLVLKPLDPFLTEEFVMGIEGGWEPEAAEGLCNAVMISRPYAPFVTRWIEGYRDFNDTDWNYHSVGLPWKLSKENPMDITVMDKNTFFYPLYFERDFALVHGDTGYDFSEQFTYHSWETLAWDKYLRDLDPEVIYTRNTAFTQLARRFVDSKARANFKKAITKI